MLKRRTLLVTPWAIWIKPGLRIRYWDVRFWTELDMDERGRMRIMIVEELDRAYWVRLKPWQHKLLCWGAG